MARPVRLTKSEKAERARAHEEKVKERKERQAWANPAKEKALLKEQEERDRAYQEQLQQQQQAQAQAAANARMEEKMTKFEKQEETAWVAAQAAIKAKQEEKKKAEAAAAKQAAQLQTTAGYFNSEKQSQASVVPAPQEKSWWEKAASFVQEKIIQPAAQSAFVRKVVLPVSLAALAVTGTANTYQWYQNVTQNPHLFDNVRQTMVEQLQTQAPSFFLDQESKWEILRSDPYTAVHDSVETLNIFLSGAANAIDTVWQQNPAVREIVKDMKIAADVACAQVESEAWQRRCIGLTYHTTAFVEHPADSLLGLGESVVIYPTEGLIKTGVFLAQYESVSLGRDLLHGWQEDGWQGLTSVAASHAVPVGQLVLADPQIQNFLIAAGILGMLAVAWLLAVPALVTTSVLGLVAVIQTAWGALGMEQAIQGLPNLQSVKEYVASHQARTFTITSLFILALAALGVTKGVSDLQSFKGPLSPTAQESFASRSWWNQLQLVDAAKAAEASPGAINFYLEHSTAADGRLAGLPLAQAFKVSSLADRSGQGGFVLDYVTQYGVDSAITKASPQGLQFFIEQSKTPGSTLSRLTPQQGVTLSELPPSSIAKVTGITTPKIPVGIIPDIKTPVLNLTPQEISVLTKLSTQNPNAEYGVLGLWKGGQGYTMKGSEGYTYLDMPEPVWDFFRDYPGDFRLINQQMLDNFIATKKLSVLETPVDEIRSLPYTPAVIWEIEYLIRKGYKLVRGGGPGGMDVLLPPK